MQATGGVPEETWKHRLGPWLLRSLGLWDPTGKPNPWYVTGACTVVSTGIFALLLWLVVTRGAGVTAYDPTIEKAHLIGLYITALALFVLPVVMYVNTQLVSQQFYSALCLNREFQPTLTAFTILGILGALLLHVSPGLAYVDVAWWLVIVVGVLHAIPTSVFFIILFSNLAVCYCVVRLIRERTKWIETELAYALEENLVTDELALRVVRTHGSSMALVRGVSKATSHLFVTVTFGMLVAAVSNATILAFQILDGEYDKVFVQSSLLLGNVTMLVIVLAFPAYVSYSAARANARLQTLCSASVELGSNNSFSTVMSISLPATPLPSASDSDTEGTSSSRTTTSTCTPTHHNSNTSKRSKNKQASAGVSGVRGGTGVQHHSHSSLRTTTPSCAGHMPGTIFELPAMALSPATGAAASSQATALSHIAIHLSSEVPAVTFGGLPITVGLLAKIGYSVVSGLVIAGRVLLID